MIGLTDEEYEELALKIIMDIDMDIYQDCIYDIENDFHNIILDDTVHNLKRYCNKSSEETENE